MPVARLIKQYRCSGLAYVFVLSVAHAPTDTRAYMRYSSRHNVIS